MAGIGDWRLSIADLRLLMDIERSWRTTFSTRIRKLAAAGRAESLD
jgi:hypothetical protein